MVAVDGDVHQVPFDIVAAGYAAFDLPGLFVGRPDGDVNSFVVIHDLEGRLLRRLRPLVGFTLDEIPAPFGFFPNGIVEFSIDRGGMRIHPFRRINALVRGRILASGESRSLRIKNSDGESRR